MDQTRKCFKCGKNNKNCPDLHLFRFPKPGTYNISRCEAWAQFCMPQAGWSSVDLQTKLYNEHRMLCHEHFKPTDFLDTARKKLKRLAIPHNHDGPQNNPDSIKASVLKDITNAPTSTLSKIDVFDAIDVKEASSPSLLCHLLSQEQKMELSDNDGNDRSYLPKKLPLAQIENMNEPSTSKLPMQTENVDIISPPEQPAVHQVPPSHDMDHSYRMPTISAKHTSGRQEVVDIISPPEQPAVHQVPPSHDMDHSYCMPTISAKHTSRRQKVDRDPTMKALYVKCRKYMKKVCILRNKLRKKIDYDNHILNVLEDDEHIKKLSKILTPTFSLLLQAQIRNFKRKSKGRRWTKEEKLVALRLYKRSPTCYRLLRRMYFLPAEATLKSLLRCFDMPVGIHKGVIQSLKPYVAEQSPSHNNFVLMFDEMSIRKNLTYNKKQDIIEGFQDHGSHGRSPVEATHALVFMLGGLRKKVKQPIAHYFSGSNVTADRLAVLIKEVLGVCFEAGINVCTTVCDMDGVNRRALTNLGATAKDPEIEVLNKQLVTIFDTPHLLKCFRNLLMKYDLKCQVDIANSGWGLAKWSHITDFYEMDNGNPNFVFAPALSKHHLAPNAKQKMKVKLAAQVLSHSVAAGMYAKISNGQLPTEATVTASVISKMDKLFDSMNSDTPDLHRGKPTATNISDTSPHKELFSEMRKFFATMEYVGCRSSPPSKEGWIWTLNGIERIWGKLKDHPDVRSLATRRLQQDPLENLFGCIRANCGDNSNPTVSQFIGGLKTAILTNMAHMGGSGNCERDENLAIINEINALLTASPSSHMDIEDDSPLVSEIMCVAEDAYNEEDLPEDSAELQACAYVCGFLLRNNKIKCQNCDKILTAQDASYSLHIFSRFKEYNDLKTSLKYASKTFVECVERCATKINNFLSHSAHVKNIRKVTTAKVTGEVNFDFLKGCAQHLAMNKDYILNSVFYICVKRFCVLKNRAYAEESSKIALKRKIDILKHK